eukprot:TRINITY_DN562_c0_g1_i1.p2 TRINITY_DN562_c0_g1~~TRINITY_DN562_c0_g1_i1.p2  ORF type:complete len:214 (+),score=35.42 TRINITY_DN562_c0_g1_i1:67-642(+)
MHTVRTAARSAVFKACSFRPNVSRAYSVKMGAQAGDAVPSATMYKTSPDDTVNLAEYVGDRTVVLFGVPGAFTPGCSKTHLPGYISLADDFKAAGVEEIICTAVNDPFVMTAWGEAKQAAGKVTMLADTQMELTKALGVELPAAPKLGNDRSKRYSAVLKGGKIVQINVEEDGTGLACSLADVALGQVKSM